MLHQLLHLQNCGRGPGLQSHDRLHSIRAGKFRQFFRFAGGLAQRPFREDVLAGIDGVLGYLVVGRHPQHHGDGVDVRVGQHILVIIEGHYRAVLPFGFLGCLHPGGADAGELVFRAGGDGGQMGAMGPPHRWAGPDNTQANLSGHHVPPSFALKLPDAG